MVKRSIDFTDAQMKWLRLAAAKAAVSVGEFVRRLIEDKRLGK